MIRTVRHRGLKRLIERGDASKINPQQVDRVRRILTLLQSAEQIEDVSLPGLLLHPLTGRLSGFWSVRVSGNWRMIFRFEDGHAFDVDLVDYH